MPRINHQMHMAAIHHVHSTSLKTRFRKSIPIYSLLLPGMLLLALFHYWPIFGIVIGFKNFSPFKGIWRSDWVGFTHFRYFLTSAGFWRVMRNTIVINFAQLIFGFPVPIVFALLLNELRFNKVKRTVQTLSYLPHFISWVVVAGIVTTLLSPSDGIINFMRMRLFGLEPVYFLAKARYFVPIIVVSGIWKQFGLGSVYYIASIASIDQELYEAAVIDGAGRMRQIWHITLPGLRNIIIVLMVLRIGRMVTIGFEQIFLLYNPLVYDVGDVISTYTYRLGIEQIQYSLTTAIGFCQSVVNFILVYTANRLAKRVAGWSLW